MGYTKYINIPDVLEIQKGDKIFIQSDISKILLSCIRNDDNMDVQNWINCFLESVGPTGMVIFPTFNWDFCQNASFDYYKTPCKTGVLGKAALKRKDFKRTRHPIYSFAVCGKDQELLCNMQNESSFGADSPFAYMHKEGVKNIIIDIDLKSSFTYVHYVEQQTAGVKYRYHKNFTGNYKDENGIVSQSTYSMFVRDLELEVINTIDPIEKDFIQNKVERKLHINNIEYKIIELDKAFDIIHKDIVENNSRKLCTFHGQ